MGLFDKLTGKNNRHDLDPMAALGLAALTIIGVDGSIDDEEVAGVTRLMRGESDAINRAILAYKDLSVEDSVALVAKCLNRQQRLACVAMLLDLAMADGLLAGAEEHLMSAYLEAFQFSETDVNPIVEVIALKNDVSIFQNANRAGA